jgi:hypothetical protein
MPCIRIRFSELSLIDQLSDGGDCAHLTHQRGIEARSTHTVERDALLLEQVIEHAPGEGTAHSSSLERKVDQFDTGCAA